MTPPPLVRPEHRLLIRRRDFLKKATGAVAVFSLGGLAACGDDDFLFERYKKTIEFLKEKNINHIAQLHY